MLKLVTLDDEGAANEVVLRVQGVLCGCALGSSVTGDIKDMRYVYSITIPND